MNLFHYCSNASLLSVLTSKEVWASEFSLSNDLLEGRWIREIFSEYCREKKINDAERLLLLNHLDGMLGFFRGAGFCMSEEGDLLSQWRAYADNGAGAAIGFNKDYFEILSTARQQRNESFGVGLHKVEYDPRRQQELISEPVEKILGLVTQGALRFPTLASLVSEEEKGRREKQLKELLFHIFLFFPYLFKLKNPAFAEEREWRLISYILKDSGEHSGQLSEMEFRALVDRLIPFRRIPLEQFEVPSITEIVLGPRNVTPDEIIHAVLRKNNWPNVHVRRSKASYR
jgi:hypothetical protein